MYILFHKSAQYSLFPSVKLGADCNQIRDPSSPGKKQGSDDGNRCTKNKKEKVLVGGVVEWMMRNKYSSLNVPD